MLRSLLTLLQEKPQYGAGSAGIGFAGGTVPSILDIPLSHFVMYLQIAALVITLMVGILTAYVTIQKIRKNRK